jgi:hypothetical protein
MRPVNVLKFTVGANQSYRLPAQGSSFKILGATGLVLVKGDWGSIDQCSIGQGITGTDFSYLVFTDLSGASNTLRVIVGDAGFIDNITGQVSITGPVTVNGAVGVNANVMPAAGAISTASVSVGVASAQILAANASRGAFSFQNRSASSNVYLAFGTAATAAAGWMVGPGQSWEPPAVPTQAVFAIADAAATPGVVLAG